MSANPKLSQLAGNRWVSVTALALGSLAVAKLTGSKEAGLAIISGTAVAAAVQGVFGGLFTSHLQKDAAAQEALNDALQNEHLARAAAEGVRLTLLNNRNARDDDQVEALADAAKKHWLKLQADRDPRIEAYAESELATRFIEYLGQNDAGANLRFLEWRNILNEVIAQDPERLDVPKPRVDELAAALARDFPRQLYTAFKTDLETGGAAFGGLVLRLLTRIAKNTHAAGKSSDLRKRDVRPLLRRMDSLLAALGRDLQPILKKLDDSTSRVLGEMADFRRDARREQQRVWWFVVPVAAALAFGVFWFLPKDQRASTKTLSNQLSQSEQRILQALRELPGALSQAAQAGQDENEAARLARAYALLEQKLGLPTNSLSRELPAFAGQLLKRADTSDRDRAAALFAQGQFAEAEDTALQAKEQALQTAGQPVKDAVAALELAGWSAHRQIQYARALEHFRAAAALTGKERDPTAWAVVRHNVAYILNNLGRAREAEPILREVLAVRERVLGTEHPDTLASRNNLAYALQGQGKHAEAEPILREVLAVRARVLGPEHPDTLVNRNNLAAALQGQGKHAEAEREHRTVLAVSERVLGPEHPNTLKSRHNLAAALDDQGKHAEAERENRTVLAGMERVLGPEHPDTLKSRNNLATALNDQGKHAEAERENRTVLAGMERVLGPEHPDTLGSGANLAFALAKQGKVQEAKPYAQRAYEVGRRVFGEEHPYMTNFKALWEQLQAAERQ